MSKSNRETGSYTYMRNNLKIRLTKAVKPTMKEILKWKITIIAIKTRLCLLFVQFIANLLILDHKSDGFICPIFSNVTENKVDRVIYCLFGGLLRWDSQYFLHIFVYGYTHENTLAFFPGFPIVAKWLGSVLQIMFPTINVISVFLISTIILNFVCFVLSVRILFDIILKESENVTDAYLCGLFFCLNPANIFFLAPYTECLFSLLTFSAIKYHDLKLSCLFVTLSAMVRSNGIINIGFPLYRLSYTFANRSSRSSWNILVFLLTAVTIVIISSSGFVLYQLYCLHSFCSSSNIAHPIEIIEMVTKENLVLAGTGNSSMCSSIIPYFYIQSRYWNVGLLHYFEMKQIPNFLLALPILSYGLYCCIDYFYKERKLIACIGFRHSKPTNNMFVLMVHLMFLLIVCFLFIHVQVSTRLLCSSSPAIYWLFVKQVPIKSIACPKIEISNLFSLKPSRFLFAYCITYSIIGTIVFSNFLPWT